MAQRPEDPNAAASAAFGADRAEEGSWTPPVEVRPVDHPLRPAGASALVPWGLRVVATLLDGFVLGVGYLVAIAITALIDETFGAVVVLVGAFVVLPLYAPLSVWRLDGQTLGKKAVRIAVRRADGRRLGLGEALVRELVLKTIGMGLLSLVVVGLVGFLWPLWDREQRAWHDLPLDTRVVRV